MKQRILIIGANGQVGKELLKCCDGLGEVISSSRTSGEAKMDLTDPDDIRSTIQSHKPSIVINAAAYTAVDKAEEEEALAMTVNATAPGIIAEQVKQIGAKLIHYSTDYVFNGSKGRPYLEDDQPNPINIYGKSKLAGDKAVDQVLDDYMILRTSWVYSTHGNNFMKTMLRLANEREEINVVNDQFGCPTSANYIAETTKSIIEFELQNVEKRADNSKSVYNLSTTTPASWYEFAGQIISNGAADDMCNSIKVNPIPTSEYPTAAERPQYSVLSNEKIQHKYGLSKISWKKDLKCVLSGSLNN